MERLGLTGLAAMALAMFRTPTEPEPLSSAPFQT